MTSENTDFAAVLTRAAEAETACEPSSVRLWLRPTVGIRAQA